MLDNLNKIFIAWVLLETSYKPYLGIILPKMSDIFEGLLVTGERRGEKECQFLRYKVQLYAGAPAYSIRTIKMSHGSVKKKKKKSLFYRNFLRISFSNLNMHQNQLGSSLKCRLGFSSLGLGPRFCISNMLPIEAAVQGLSRMVPGILNNTSLKLIGPLRAEKGYFHLVSLGSCFNQLLKGTNWLLWTTPKVKQKPRTAISDWHIKCPL